MTDEVAAATAVSSCLSRVGVMALLRATLSLFSIVGCGELGVTRVEEERQECSGRWVCKEALLLLLLVSKFSSLGRRWGAFVCVAKTPAPPHVYVIIRCLGQVQSLPRRR
jgi:hypothetical protein